MMPEQVHAMAPGGLFAEVVECLRCGSPATVRLHYDYTDSDNDRCYCIETLCADHAEEARARRKWDSDQPVRYTPEVEEEIRLVWPGTVLAPPAPGRRAS